MYLLFKVIYLQFFMIRSALFFISIIHSQILSVPCTRVPQSHLTLTLTRSLSISTCSLAVLLSLMWFLPVFLVSPGHCPILPMCFLLHRLCSNSSYPEPRLVCLVPCVYIPQSVQPLSHQNVDHLLCADWSVSQFIWDSYTWHSIHLYTRFYWFSKSV